MLPYNNQENPVIIEPENPSGVIIWLHGLGDTGYNFYSGIFDYLLPEVRSNYRHIFPTAPIIPVTINGGIPMPAWYDILSLQDMKYEDEKGILSAVEYVNGLIASQAKDLKCRDKIILVGFSQGGGVAIHSALTTKYKLRRVLLCSSYVPLLDKIANLTETINKKTKMTYMHGVQDDVVTLSLMNKGYAKLEGMGFQLEKYCFHGRHQLDVQCLNENLLQDLQ